MWQAIAGLLVALLKYLLESAVDRRRLSEQERELAEDAHGGAMDAALLRIQQARHGIEVERERVRETYEAARRRRNSDG